MVRTIQSDPAPLPLVHGFRANLSPVILSHVAPSHDPAALPRTVLQRPPSDGAIELLRAASRSSAGAEYQLHLRSLGFALSPPAQSGGAGPAAHLGHDRRALVVGGGHHPAPHGDLSLIDITAAARPA